MISEDMKIKTASNLAWRFAERIGAHGFSFILSVVLARLLLPEQFGLIAMVTVFTTIMVIIIDCGTANALIQKKDADDTDFSSAFYFNAFLGVVSLAFMFVVAPLIAGFYGEEELTGLVRALGFMLPIQGLVNVQLAYVSRMLIFKKLFFATMGATVGSGVIGVWMAYTGYGAWAIVGQRLSCAAMSAVILWLGTKWRPRFLFSLGRLKGLLRYGWKLLATSLLDSGYASLGRLVIGRLYTPSDLAFYSKGQIITDSFVYSVNDSVDAVILPVMSQVQGSPPNVRAIARRAIKTGSYFMWPLMLGLCVVAEPLVRLVLTEKWIETVPYLRIFCLICVFNPLHTANLGAIKAMGRSDLILKLALINKTIGIAALLVVMRHSVMAIMCSMLFAAIISSFINAYPNKKILDYRYFEQVRDILPTIALTAVMIAAVYPIAVIGMDDFWTLSLQLVTGLTIYVLGSVVLKLESFTYAMALFRSYRKRWQKRTSPNKTGI